jgi:hypothetical protein
MKAWKHRSREDGRRSVTKRPRRCEASSPALPLDGGKARGEEKQEV